MSDRASLKDLLKAAVPGGETPQNNVGVTDKGDANIRITAGKVLPSGVVERVEMMPNGKRGLVITSLESELARPVGRPRTGKRSDPNYERLTVLLQKDTRRSVELKMLQHPGEHEDLSDLVEALLSEWAGKKE